MFVAVSFKGFGLLIVVLLLMVLIMLILQFFGV